MEAPKRRRERDDDVPLARGSAPGAGVDASGNPVLDPTANVLALVAASIKRQDDLGALTDTLTLERIKRVEDLQIKDYAHGMAMLRLSTEHAKEVREIRGSANEKLIGLIIDAIDKLTLRVGPLEKAVAESQAKGVGVANAWGFMVGGAGLFATLIMIGLFLFNGKTAPTTANVPTPQVVLVPAAPGTMVQSSPQQAPAR
jgi:hypothetical protein